MKGRLGGNINLRSCWIHELYCQTHEQTNFDGGGDDYIFRSLNNLDLYFYSKWEQKISWFTMKALKSAKNENTTLNLFNLNQLQQILNLVRFRLLYWQLRLLANPSECVPSTPCQCSFGGLGNLHLDVNWHDDDSDDDIYKYCHVIPVNVTLPATSIPVLTHISHLPNGPRRTGHRVANG